MVCVWISEDGGNGGDFVAEDLVVDESNGKSERTAGGTFKVTTLLGLTLLDFDEVGFGVADSALLSDGIVMCADDDIVYARFDGVFVFREVRSSRRLGAWIVCVGDFHLSMSILAMDKASLR